MYDKDMEKETKIEPFTFKDALKVIIDNPFTFISVIMLTILTFK